LLHPKKVGYLPIENSDKVKRTNEIKTAAPLLDTVDVKGKNVTADALLTQRDFADYLVIEREAHYFFNVKGNQQTLLDDIKLYFENRKKPDYTERGKLEHGRIETRKIWTTDQLSGYLDFPHVKQAFIIERHVYHKTNNKKTVEIAYGITSRPPEEADAKKILEINRGHWCIENKCHYILDVLFAEDQGQIRKGYGPENVSRLRRFAVGTLLFKGVTNVTQKTRELARNTRQVFDYLGMTLNTRPAAARA